MNRGTVFVYSNVILAIVRTFSELIFYFYSISGKTSGMLPPLVGNDEYDSGIQGHVGGGGVFGDVGPNSGGHSTGTPGATNPFNFVPGSTRNSSPRSQTSSVSAIGSIMGNYDPNSSERFSRKVFVGGLPPDIDEGKCTLLQCMWKTGQF